MAAVIASRGPVRVPSGAQLPVSRRRAALYRRQLENQRLSPL